VLSTILSDDLVFAIADRAEKRYRRRTLWPKNSQFVVTFIIAARLVKTYRAKVSALFSGNAEEVFNGCRRQQFENRMHFTAGMIPGILAPAQRCEWVSLDKRRSRLGPVLGREESLIHE